MFWNIWNGTQFGDWVVAPSSSVSTNVKTVLASVVFFPILEYWKWKQVTSISSFGSPNSNILEQFNYHVTNLTLWHNHNQAKFKIFYKKYYVIFQQNLYQIKKIYVIFWLNSYQIIISYEGDLDFILILLYNFVFIVILFWYHISFWKW